MNPADLVKLPRGESKMAWKPHKINFIMGFLAIIVPISQITTKHCVSIKDNQN